MKNIVKFLKDSIFAYVSFVIGTVAIITFFAIIIASMMLPILLTSFYNSSELLLLYLITIPIGIIFSGLLEKHYYKH